MVNNTVAFSSPPKLRPCMALYVPQPGPLPTPPRLPRPPNVTLSETPSLAKPSASALHWALPLPPCSDCSPLQGDCLPSRTVGGVGVYLFLIVTSRPLLVTTVQKRQHWSSCQQLLLPVAVSAGPRPPPAALGHAPSFQATPHTLQAPPRGLQAPPHSSRPRPAF